LVKLDSNGTSPVMLEYLLENKLVDFIAMDIKASVDKYSCVTERYVDTQVIEKSIDLIMSSGIDYEFRTTVVRGQLDFDDFEQIGKMIKGAKRYAAQKFVPTKTNNPEFMNKSSYSDDDMQKIKLIMSNYVDVCVVH